jgi:hypothetical protein
LIVGWPQVLQPPIDDWLKPKSGSFLSKWNKKVAALNRKIRRNRFARSVQRIGSSARMPVPRASRPTVAAGSITGLGKANVQLVFCG